MSDQDFDPQPETPSLRDRAGALLGAGVWRLERAFKEARAENKAAAEGQLRVALLLAGFSLAFVFVAAGATRAALFRKLEPDISAPPVAGRVDLIDREGSLIAVDLTHYGLYVDPKLIWDQAETRAVLKPMLPAQAQGRLERTLQRGDKRICVLRGLTPEQKAKLDDLGLPGVQFEPEAKRFYPLGKMAAHLVGYVDSGGLGIAGAEKALDGPIRGEPDPTLKVQPAPEAPVSLSIDLRVQAALEDELQKAAAQFTPKGAVGVVTNVHTGEILGMASWPDFDPNAPGRYPYEMQANRAAATVYEMGSTFKAFTVAIGLDSGVATPSSTFDATVPYKLGYRTIHDYHAARKVLTLVEVFQHSSNIGTAKLAVAVGPERLSRYFTKLGLTKPADVELRESARPLTPKVWNEDAVASTSFGHGMNVTPLALTEAMGALLNGGLRVPLTIRARPADWRPKGERVLSEKTSREMLAIMRANVTGGSGGKADAPGLSVGGKTGTGEKYDPAIRKYNHERQVSSFAAVFPTDGPLEAPRYFVLILMDEPHGTKETYGFSTGGWVAAPAAGRVIDRVAPFLGVRRDPSGLVGYVKPKPQAVGEDGEPLAAPPPAPKVPAPTTRVATLGAGTLMTAVTQKSVQR